MSQHQKLTLLVQECKEAKDIDSQFALLREINSALPFYERIALPSLVTDDYCRRALEVIEDKIGKALRSADREFSWPPQAS